jgi:hypothetical protein
MLLRLCAGLLARSKTCLRQQVPREVRRSRVCRMSRSSQLHRARKIAAAAKFGTSIKTSERWRGRG